jgi:hypothetical protein
MRGYHAHSAGLEGKMDQVEIVVEAILDGRSIPDGDADTYYFRKGDVGVLRWHGIPQFYSGWEAYVVWDMDASKVERRILFEHLGTVGITFCGLRVLLQ